MQCLKKKPDDRTHDIADARVALSVLEEVGDTEVRSSQDRSGGDRRGGTVVVLELGAKIRFQE